jgi:thymidylate synthase
MKQYHDLVNHVLATGVRKENRTGVDSLSTFGYYYEHDLRDGFPLLTTKAVSWKNIVIELLWFLSGSDKADFLRRHGCKFWEPWTDGHGTVSNCYGPAWRQFPVHERGASYIVRATQKDEPYNDQIAWVVAELKRNPLSRRMVVDAWAPGIAQTAKLPPCHAMFILNVQNESWLNSMEKGDGEGGFKQRLCLHLTQRSCDIALGIPYNLASYALLLSLFARFSGIEPGIFGHSLVDAHIYTAKPDGSMANYDHVPGLMEQVSREPFPLPKLVIDDSIKNLEDVEALLHPSVSTEDIMSKSHPAIKFEVAV